ncbi:hypothetical protein KC19_1G276400 [Ceratodon purpureus]|uniref:Uncharacterized protein n=1 Tax=Ceratodon purpureus TaxID=3225 RepID=A0A8T0J9Y8_CERPU|nr:hypothetical protein KC19_1G276400 [Ceratodon purpureus]
MPSSSGANSQRCQEGVTEFSGRPSDRFGITSAVTQLLGIRCRAWRAPYACFLRRRGLTARKTGIGKLAVYAGTLFQGSLWFRSCFTFCLLYG